MIGVNETNKTRPDSLGNLPPYIPQTPCLAMRPREAAKALGISERLLWEWTDRGVVPHIRLGKAILYPVDALREWLQREAQQKMALKDQVGWQDGQDEKS